MSISLTRAFILLPVLIIQSLAAEERIGCMVDVISKYENFAKRAKTQIWQKFEKDSDITPIDKSYLSNYMDLIDIRVSYPVHIFPKKTTAYIRLSSKSIGNRDLCISHATRDFQDITYEDQIILINQITSILTRQIKVENGIISGEKLESGRYANNIDISLASRKLNVEVIGKPKKRGNTLGALLPLTTPKPSMKRRAPKGAKSLDIQILGSPKKQLPKIEPKKVEKPVVAQPKRKSLKQEQLAIDTAQLNPKSSLKTQLSPAEKIKKLREELELEWEARERSNLYHEMALMYFDVHNFNEAYAYSQKALAENPKNLESQKLKNSLQGPMREPVQRFRFQNQRRDITIKTKLGIEWDSNVVQEAIDPFFQTEKEDIIFHLGLMTNKAWRLPWRHFSNDTFLNLHLSRHAEHPSLDVFSQDLGHRMGYRFIYGRNIVHVAAQGAASHFFRQGQSLLWNKQLGASASLYIDVLNTLASVNGAFLDTTYRPRFREKLERDGFQNRVSFSLTHFIAGHREFSFRAEAGAQAMRPRDGTLKYDEEFAKVSARYQPSKWVINKISIFIQASERDFLNAERGRLPREDNRLEYGFNTQKNFLKYHTMSLDIKYTDNDANRRINRYRRTQASISYRVDF